MRKSGYYYLYPAYFEAGRSRQAGRRIPKKLALSTVNTSMIKNAAQRLGLECTIEPQARYPSSWWGTPGLVLIKKPAGKSKTQLLKELAKTMATLKSAGVK
jgi:signal recognition particle subunit SRP19